MNNPPTDLVFSVGIATARTARQRRCYSRSGSDPPGNWPPSDPVGFVPPKPAWVDRFEPGLDYGALGLDTLSTRTYGETAFGLTHQHAEGISGF